MIYWLLPCYYGTESETLSTFIPINTRSGNESPTGRVDDRDNSQITVDLPASRGRLSVIPRRERELSFAENVTFKLAATPPPLLRFLQGATVSREHDRLSANSLNKPVKIISDICTRRFLKCARDGPYEVRKAALSTYRESCVYLGQ